MLFFQSLLIFIEFVYFYQLNIVTSYLGALREYPHFLDRGIFLSQKTQFFHQIVELIDLGSSGISVSFRFL